MVADRADFRSFGTDNNVTADAAFPHRHFALEEDVLHLNVVEQLTITFFVGLFDGADHTELGSDFREAFFFGFLGKRCIHVGPFVVFAVGCSLQVSGRVADAAQVFKPKLGMFLFIAGRGQEDFRELFIAFVTGNGSEVRVLVAGLRFTGEGRPQVLFSLGAGELGRAATALLFFNDGLEVGGVLVADGADVVSGEAVAFLDVAANLATEFHVFLLK